MLGKFSDLDDIYLEGQVNCLDTLGFRGDEK